MSNTNERLNEIIKNIQKHISGINEIYDKRKLSLQSDLSFFEDASKNLLSLKASLEMYTEQQKKLPELSVANPNRQLGLFMSNLAPKFKDTQSEIFNACTKLKQQKIELNKHSQKFQTESSDSISKIQAAIKTYFDNINKAKQMKVNTAKETLELGQQLQFHYMTLLRAIGDNRKDLDSSIDESDDFLKNSLNEEDDTVKSAVQTFFKSFQIPYTDAQNKIDARQVSYYKELIDAEFFMLFGATGVFPSKQYSCKEVETPFMARVWDDFKSDAGAEQCICVKKREMVSVEKVTMNTHWLVKNSKNEVGMVPAAILEPLKLQ